MPAISELTAQQAGAAYLVLRDLARANGYGPARDRAFIAAAKVAFEALMEPVRQRLRELGAPMPA